MISASYFLDALQTVLQRCIGILLSSKFALIWIPNNLIKMETCVELMYFSHLSFLIFLSVPGLFYTSGSFYIIGTMKYSGWQHFWFMFMLLWLTVPDLELSLHLLQEWFCRTRKPIMGHLLLGTFHSFSGIFFVQMWN